MTFWFLWTSPTFFHCPRLHPVITVRSESPPLRPQSLQLSDIIVLLIQLPKQRHRATEQPIPTKNGQKLHHMRRLKFLPHEHALHAPPVSLTCSHAPHTLVPMLSRATTRLLHFTYCHVSPKVTSHCHVSH